MFLATVYYSVSRPIISIAAVVLLHSCLCTVTVLYVSFRAIVRALNNYLEQINDDDDDDDDLLTYLGCACTKSAEPTAAVPRFTLNFTQTDPHESRFVTGRKYRVVDITRRRAAVAAECAQATLFSSDFEVHDERS